MPIPVPEYQYQPVYGVEPWKKNGPMYSDLAGLVPVARWIETWTRRLSKQQPLP